MHAFCLTCQEYLDDELDTSSHINSEHVVEEHNEKVDF